MLDMSSLLRRDKNEPTKTLRPFCRTPCTVKHNTVALLGRSACRRCRPRRWRAYSTNGGRHDCLVRDANDGVLGTPDQRGASPEAVLLGLWRRPSWPRSSSTSAGSFAGGAAGGVSAQISHRSCCPYNRWELTCQGSWLRRLPLYIRAGTLLPTRKHLRFRAKGVLTRIPHTKPRLSFGSRFPATSGSLAPC